MRRIRAHERNVFSLFMKCGGAPNPTLDPPLYCVFLIICDLYVDMVNCKSVSGMPTLKIDIIYNQCKVIADDFCNNLHMSVKANLSKKIGNLK